MDRFARRSFGALAFVLMLLRVVAPELGHQCAMDVATQVASVVAPNGPHAAAVHTGDTHDAHAAHGGHTGHERHASGATTAAMPATHHTPADTPDSGCECADWCCCLPTVADTPRPVVALAIITAQQSRVVTASRSEAPRAAAARLLPFATAPPAV